MSEVKLTEGSANMLLLAGFGILVSGYLGFATRREGKSLVRASLLASLSAAVLQAIVGVGTVWLSGTPLPYADRPHGADNKTDERARSLLSHGAELNGFPCAKIP
jgi:hypothetical protein